jgi:hypothetical protein
MNPLHTLTPYTLNLHFNNILSSTLGLRIYRFPSAFVIEIIYAFVISPMRATYSMHPIPIYP